MAEENKRGSEKLLAAWKGRALTEESLQEIASALAQSPATVDRAMIVGGNSATGAHLSLSYTGDDTPICGNDIAFWLKWHLKHGGSPRPPRIIIDGIPFPDLVRMELDFGNVVSNPVVAVEVAGLGRNVGA